MTDPANQIIKQAASGNDDANTLVEKGMSGGFVIGGGTKNTGNTSNVIGEGPLANINNEINSMIRAMTTVIGAQSINDKDTYINSVLMNAYNAAGRAANMILASTSKEEKLYAMQFGNEAIEFMMNVASADNKDTKVQLSKLYTMTPTQKKSIQNLAGYGWKLFEAALQTNDLIRELNTIKPLFAKLMGTDEGQELIEKAQKGELR